MSNSINYLTLINQFYPKVFEKYSDKIFTFDNVLTVAKSLNPAATSAPNFSGSLFNYLLCDSRFVYMGQNTWKLQVFVNSIIDKKIKLYDFNSDGNDAESDDIVDASPAFVPSSEKVDEPASPSENANAGDGASSSADSDDDDSSDLE